MAHDDIVVENDIQIDLARAPAVRRLPPDLLLDLLDLVEKRDGVEHGGDLDHGVGEHGLLGDVGGRRHVEEGRRHQLRLFTRQKPHGGVEVLDAVTEVRSQRDVGDVRKLLQRLHHWQRSCPPRWRRGWLLLGRRRSFELWRGDDRASCEEDLFARARDLTRCCSRSFLPQRFRFVDEHSYLRCVAVCQHLPRNALRQRFDREEFALLANSPGDFGKRGIVVRALQFSLCPPVPVLSD
mmetsp:Transcript_10044/g.23371  ORF Transcript_10044/g.23371 Transcript_10044/m.23371 type:complete len:238 (-) Transcript_10044:440-1153(-)